MVQNGVKPFTAGKTHYLLTLWRRQSIVMLAMILDGLEPSLQTFCVPAHVLENDSGRLSIALYDSALA